MCFPISLQSGVRPGGSSRSYRKIFPYLLQLLGTPDSLVYGSIYLPPLLKSFTLYLLLLSFSWLPSLSDLTSVSLPGFHPQRLLFLITLHSEAWGVLWWPSFSPPRETKTAKNPGWKVTAVDLPVLPWKRMFSLSEDFKMVHSHS